MLNRRDEQVLARLIQVNGITDVLTEIETYAFGRIGGKSQVWCEVYAILAETVQKTREAIQRQDRKDLGIFVEES